LLRKFNEFDTNGNGQLSPAEITESLTHPSFPPPPLLVAWLLPSPVLAWFTPPGVGTRPTGPSTSLLLLSLHMLRDRRDGPKALQVPLSPAEINALVKRLDQTAA
jgi:hypothetical protein